MDIYILVKRFLCALKDLQSDDEPVLVDTVYSATKLGGFNLPEAMRLIFNDHLIPQNLVVLSDNNHMVRITPEGRQICDNILAYEDREWRQRLAELEPEFRRLGLVP
jgi:hypothetical protein